MFLNACYSKVQAEMIVRHVECAIGMSQAVADVTAVAFAKAFYQGLAYGESVATAFEASLVQLRLMGLLGRRPGPHRDSSLTGEDTSGLGPGNVPFPEMIERTTGQAARMVFVGQTVSEPPARPGPVRAEPVVEPVPAPALSDPSHSVPRARSMMSPGRPPRKSRGWKHRRGLSAP